MPVIQYLQGAILLFAGFAWFTALWQGVTGYTFARALIITVACICIALVIEAPRQVIVRW